MRFDGAGFSVSIESLISLFLMQEWKCGITYDAMSPDRTLIKNPQSLNLTELLWSLFRIIWGTLLFVVGSGRTSSSCFLLSFPFAFFFFMGLLVTGAGRRVIARRGEVELLFLIHFLFDFYFFLLLPPLYYVYEMGPLGYSFLLLQPLLYRYYQSICPLHLWEQKNDGEA